MYNEYKSTIVRKVREEDAEVLQEQKVQLASNSRIVHLVQLDESRLFYQNVPTQGPTRRLFLPAGGWAIDIPACRRKLSVRDTIPVLCEYSFLWIREQVICNRSGDFVP